MAKPTRAVRIAVLVLGLLGSAVLSGMGPLSAHGSATAVSSYQTGSHGAGGGGGAGRGTGSGITSSYQTGGSGRGGGLPLLPAV